MAQQFNISVHNQTAGPISCFISKYSNTQGDDSWFVIPAGGVEVWRRRSWEVVAFKNAGDTARVGSYLKMDHNMDVNIVTPLGEITHT